MMVWLETETNEYRRLILPLAKNHLILRFAVCAISAAHVPQEPDYGSQFSRATCEAAITKITEQVRRMTTCANDGLMLDEKNRSVEGTLAAMLMLANQSLFGSDLSRARSHRQAARILLDTLLLKKPSTDELVVFLRNQMALCDVLACTTLFNADHMESVTMPDIGCGGVIHGHFLTIVHELTTRSVRPRDSEAVLESLESRFALATGSSLLVAGQMMGPRPQNQPFQEDFIRLMHIFHHAGILYAIKRLQLSIDLAEEYHVSRLLTALQEFHDIRAVIHNLAWPVFIAGICICHSPERKIIVVDVCRLMSSHTPFQHYARILTFLRHLWQTSHQNWILLATEWEGRGDPIVAV